MCGGNDASVNVSVYYKDSALELVRNLSVLAPKSDGFSVGSTTVSSGKNVTVYGLAQCWEFVNGSACRECLADAATRIASCATKGEEGRALNSGCYLRYSTQKFYNNSTSDAAPAGNHGELYGPSLVLSQLSVCLVHNEKC